MEKKKEKKRITHRTLKRRNEDILDVIYTKKHYIFTLFVVSMFISISNLSLLIIVCFFYTKKKTPIESYWPLSGLSKKSTLYNLDLDLYLIIYDRSIAIYILRIVYKIILKLCCKRHPFVSMFLIHNFRDTNFEKMEPKS